MKSFFGSDEFISDEDYAPSSHVYQSPVKVTRCNKVYKKNVLYSYENRVSKK
jgi:hypothetical protein